MISARIGLSEAGKRIHAAGGAFSAFSPAPFPDPVLVATVQAALDGKIVDVSEPVAAGPSCRDVAARVAAEHGLTLSDIVSSSRPRGVMPARFEAYYRCIMATNASVTDIGRRLGDRNHATVLNGITRHCMAKGLPMPRGLSPRHRK